MCALQKRLKTRSQVLLQEPESALLHDSAESQGSLHKTVLQYMGI